jgi:hypothetical protein
MSFAGLNLWAVLAAAVAGFAFGAAWYKPFGKAWLAAVGKTEAELKRGMATTFVAAFAAELVMAFMLAGLVWHLGGATLRTGMISAGLVWLGFVVTTLVVNHRFQGAKTALTVIDGGHWLGVLLIQGAVIGAFGAP